MRSIGDGLSWMNRWKPCLLTLWLLTGAPTLRAEDEPVDTFHVSDRAIAAPNGNGWSVNPRLGQLAVTIPIGVMPGEISFPVSLTMNATSTTRSKKVLLGYTGPNDNNPVYGIYSNTTPVSCGVNLCAITPAPGGVRITLEDGRTYYNSDFLKTATAFADHTTTPTKLFRAFGFSEPPANIISGLPGSATGPQFPGWAVSADGALIFSNMSSFPAKYQTLISSLLPSTSLARQILNTCRTQVTPVVFGIGAPEMTVAGVNSVVLMDKDRVRVFARVKYKVPDHEECVGGGQNGSCTMIIGESGSIYLPIFIADRFGHYVTMRWSTSELLRRVDVLNQRGQGFTVRMHNRSTDLARLDFVECSGPSALIQGGGPSPYWLSHYPETLEPKPAPKTTWGPESIGLPTQITLGTPENVPQPSWNGTLGDPSSPPPTVASGGSVPDRVWNLVYNDAHSALTSIMEPNGVESQFKTRTFAINQTPNWFEFITDVYPIPDNVNGVEQVDQTDQSGKSSASRRFTWERQVGGYGISVTQKDWWNPSVNQVDRYTNYQYGDISNANAAMNNPTDRGNGFLNSWALFSTDSQVWAKVNKTSQTAKTNPTYSKGSGLNGYLSIPHATISFRLGELAKRKVYTYADDTSLQASAITSSVRPNDSSPWTPIHTHLVTYNNRWGMLETQQVNQSVSTRSTLAGTQLTPDCTTNVWDSANPPLLQLMQTFRNNSGLKHGSTFTYDGQGRLATQEVYHFENNTVLPSPNTLTIAYDDEVTGQPIDWATTYIEGTGTGTLTKTQGNFDNGHRPQLMVNEKGVSTHTTYDFYGRPTLIEKGGEAPLTLSYPDEWTKITTQGGKTTKHYFDGFGRLIKQELLEGATLVLTTIPTYDLHSRVVATTETNKVGASRTSTTSYDILNRVTSQTSFSGKRVDLTYSTDGFNNVVTQTVDPLGLALVTITKTDPFGQVVSVTAPNGDVTSYTYDGHGNKTQVTITPAGGGTSQIRTFTYDLLGRLTSKLEPETGTQTFSNFNALNQAQVLNEIGIVPANGSRTRTLTYDGLGRLRSQSNGNVVEAFYYQGPFLKKTRRTVGDDSIRQSFSYSGPGARLSQESTTSQVLGQ